MNVPQAIGGASMSTENDIGVFFNCHGGLSEKNFTSIIAQLSDGNKVVVKVGK